MKEKNWSENCTHIWGLKYKFHGCAISKTTWSGQGRIKPKQKTNAMK
jgi:hypothetical protein